MPSRNSAAVAPDRRTFARALLAVGIWAIVPGNASAYVDPGSGLLIIQGLLALIGGVIVFVKNPIAAFKRLWARCFPGARNRDRENR
jgi:hypothetical protein